MVAFLVGGLIGKVLVSVVAVFGTIRYGSGLYFWRVTENLERPDYVVIRKLSNGVELRRYDPYLIAETTTDGVGFREPTRDGFRTCAGYIFGKNEVRNVGSFWGGWSRSSRSATSEKMDMTAPVRVSCSSSEKMEMTAPVRINGGEDVKTKVSFVIGSKYSLKTAPKPIDKNITIREVPSHTLAVRKFSGLPPKDDRVKEERQIIQQSLNEVNLQPSGYETLVYGYHDPFITPNFLRRNEVAVVVEGSI